MSTARRVTWAWGGEECIEVIPAPGAPPLTFYNPNHSAKNGQFIKGGGGHASGIAGALATGVTLDQLRHVGGNQEDPLVAALVKQHGFDGKPRVGSAADVDAAVAAGATELYRTVGSRRSADALMHGTFFTGMGETPEGGGLFTTPDLDTARRIQGSVLRMALAKDARVATNADISAGMERDRQAALADLDARHAERFDAAKAHAAANPTAENWQKVADTVTQKQHDTDYINAVYSKPTRYAALQGYDAYRGAFGAIAGSEQVVILNRTKLLIQADPLQATEPEQFYNPNHSKADGKFTKGPSGGAGALHGAHAEDGPDIGHLNSFLIYKQSKTQLADHMVTAGFSMEYVNGLSHQQMKDTVAYFKGTNQFKGDKTPLDIKTKMFQGSAAVAAAKRHEPLTGEYGEISHQKMATHYSQFNGPHGITDDERAKLHAYQGSTYTVLNAYLRGKPPPPSMMGADGNWRPESKAQVAALANPMKSAIKKAYTPDNLVVYRGMRLPDYPDKLVGKTLMDKAFQSTSLDRSVAGDFAAKKEPPPAGIVRIKVPKGTRGVYMDGLPFMEQGEQELLLPPGGGFKVIGVDKLGNVEADYIPPPGYEPATFAEPARFYNPNHSKKDGKFTKGPGGNPIGGQGALADHLYAGHPSAGPNMQHLNSFLIYQQTKPQLAQHMIDANFHPDFVNSLSHQQMKDTVAYFKGTNQFKGDKTPLDIKTKMFLGEQPAAQHVASAAAQHPVSSSVQPGVNHGPAPVSLGTLNFPKHDYAIFHADYQSQITAISLDEYSVIKHYQGSGYFGMNATLRGKPKDGKYAHSGVGSWQIKQKIETLKGALAKTETKRDVAVFKGTRIPDHPAAMVGKVITDKAFASASLKATTAKAFKPAPPPPSAILKINVPAGTNALFMDAWKAYPYEHELLLPPGASFKVTGVDSYGNVECDYIAPPGFK